MESISQESLLGNCFDQNFHIILLLSTYKLIMLIVGYYLSIFLYVVYVQKIDMV